MEAWELLDRLDQELVQLETRPSERPLIDSIFRVMHTLKGGGGFLQLTNLVKLSHSAESLLDQVREGERVIDPPLVDLLFAAADAVRGLLVRLEKEGQEGELGSDVLERLERYAAGEIPAAAPVAFEDVTEPDEEPEAPELATSGGWVRVRVEQLDKLMNLVGELVLCRNQLLQVSTRSENDSLTSGTQRLNLVTSELQEHITRTRMQAVGTILSRFPRTVREMSRQQSKDVRLVLEGQDTGLDRTILEAIRDPLLHIVRNALDHGLESPEERLSRGKPARGTLLIRAFHEGGQVTIEVSDDGRGIDPARIRERALQRGHRDVERMSERDLIRLILQPGFSTVDEVTSVSGRGVGMDVARTSVEQIGGTVDVSTVLGCSTTIRLRIPLTLAIIPALMVRVGEQTYAIPQVNLQELVHLDPSALERVHGAEVYRLRGDLLPLLRLRTLMNVPGEDDNANIVVLQADGRSFGLVVDAECDTEEIVVKPLMRDLKKLQLYAGATIMGDGRVALILDAPGLARSSGLVFEEVAERETRGDPRRQTQAQSVLLFRLGDSQLYGIPLVLVSRLEEFPAEKVEQSAGGSMIQYRGRLLPLVHLAHALGVPEPEGEILRVLVFSHGDRNLGVVVGDILDVVEDVFELEEGLIGRDGVLGSAIIGGAAVTVVDVLGLLRKTSPDWLRRPLSRDTRARGSTVLLAHDSDFYRSLTRSFLEAEGYLVLEAASREKALEYLSQEEEIDSVVVDVGMEGSRELLLLASGERPAVGLATRESDRPSLERTASIEVVADFDRHNLLDALKRSREGKP